MFGSRRFGSGVLGSRRVGLGTLGGCLGCRVGERCGVRRGVRCGVRRRRGLVGGVRDSVMGLAHVLSAFLRIHTYGFTCAVLASSFLNTEMILHPSADRVHLLYEFPGLPFGRDVLRIRIPDGYGEGTQSLRSGPKGPEVFFMLLDPIQKLPKIVRVRRLLSM